MFVPPILGNIDYNQGNTVFVLSLTIMAAALLAQAWKSSDRRLGLLGALFLLPNTRSWLTRGGTSDRRLDRAKKLLEVRRLQIEVEALRARHPDAAASVLDPHIEALLSAAEHEDAGAPSLTWRERAPLAIGGAAFVLLFGLVALAASGGRTGAELTRLALSEAALLAPCGLLASLLPSRSRWGSALYGVAVPMLVAAIVVAARARG